MISIVNISDESAPLVGDNQYELRINNRVMTTFQHERSVDGLPRCLRDAADAMDAKRVKDAQRFNEDALLQLATILSDGVDDNPSQAQIKKAKRKADRPPASPSEVLFKFFADQGLTIERAAERMGVSAMVLYRLKSSNSVSVKLAVMLEEHFNIKASQLFYIEEQYKRHKLQRALERAKQREEL
ncbi:MAG: hypothetical protein GY833_12870 [Aestuariibacter sp.]|nr:hypothetical protein [Aestuariibacter sp.]